MNSNQDWDNTTGEYYTLETVEQITRISRDRILFYRQHGLITTVSASQPEEPRFDDEAVHRLRQIATLLNEYGVNDRGLHLISSLLDEVERLRREVRFLRG